MQHISEPHGGTISAKTNAHYLLNGFTPCVYRTALVRAYVKAMCGIFTSVGLALKRNSMFFKVQNNSPIEKIISSKVCICLSECDAFFNNICSSFAHI